MAKGEPKSTREEKKPTKDKAAKGAAGAMPNIGSGKK